MEFRVSTYLDTDVIGAEVNVISGDTVVDTIAITDATSIQTLNNQIQNIINNYETKADLTTTLTNTDGSTTINATKLSGNVASDFAPAIHSHINYAPTEHKSTASTFGVGDETRYGHVKTINNLTDNTYVSGRALSSYQGKVLNDKINNTPYRGCIINNNPVIARGNTATWTVYKEDGSPLSNVEFTIKYTRTFDNYAEITRTTDSNGVMSYTIPTGWTTGMYHFYIYPTNYTDNRKINTLTFLSVY